jgi:hypothetical protein
MFGRPILPFALAVVNYLLLLFIIWPRQGTEKQTYDDGNKVWMKFFYPGTFWNPFILAIFIQKTIPLLGCKFKSTVFNVHILK